MTTGYEWLKKVELSASELDSKPGAFSVIPSGPQIKTGWLFRSHRASEATVISVDQSIRDAVAGYTDRDILVQDAVVCLMDGIAKVCVGQEGRGHLFGAMKDGKGPTVAIGQSEQAAQATLGLWVPGEQRLIVADDSEIVEHSVPVEAINNGSDPNGNYAHVPLINLPN